MAQSLTVTAAEANRSFSRLLRAASQGKRVTITSYGKPVAELGPAPDAQGERQKIADLLAEMEAHWATLEPKRIEPWSRDELYDRSRR